MYELEQMILHPTLLKLMVAQAHSEIRLFTATQVGSFNTFTPPHPKGKEKVAKLLRCLKSHDLRTSPLFFSVLR